MADCELRVIRGVCGVSLHPYAGAKNRSWLVLEMYGSGHRVGPNPANPADYPLMIETEEVRPARGQVVQTPQTAHCPDEYTRLRCVRCGIDKAGSQR